MYLNTSFISCDSDPTMWLETETENTAYRRRAYSSDFFNWTEEPHYFYEGHKLQWFRRTRKSQKFLVHYTEWFFGWTDSHWFTSKADLQKCILNLLPTWLNSLAYTFTSTLSMFPPLVSGNSPVRMSKLHAGCIWSRNECYFILC
jgi:hypothetical protein